MARLLEKLWIVAMLSLAIHIGVVALMRFCVPPPTYAAKSSAAPYNHAPEVIPLPHEPPKQIVREDLNQFGEKTGEGNSISSLDLPDEMRSKTVHDIEQAWTKQKPIVSSHAPSEQASKKNAALVPSGLQTDLPAMSRQKIGKGSGTIETPDSDRPADSQPSDGQASDGKQGSDPAKSEAGQTNPVPEDPAPRGESDLDPFAEAEGISLVGGTKARKGRELKFSKPRIDLAFRAAFTRLAGERMRVAFQISTDELGRPRNVILLESSGSNDIDEALKLAIYDSWFGGKMPDTFPFVIAFYE